MIVKHDSASIITNFITIFLSIPNFNHISQYPILTTLK